MEWLPARPLVPVLTARLLELDRAREVPLDFEKSTTAPSLREAPERDVADRPLVERFVDEEEPLDRVEFARGVALFDELRDVLARGRFEFFDVPDEP